MSFDAVPDNSLLTRLRQATAPRHEAIEDLLRLDAAVSEPHYRRVLAGFAVFLPAWEQAVRAALPADLAGWFDARSRLGFLREDLQALAIAPPHEGPDVAGALSIGSPAEAFGSMYVIEGSALGGQFIAKAVARSLGLTPQAGAAYFHGWGDATAANWRAFRQLLEQRVAQVDHPDAADAAVRTFEALASTFRPLMTSAA